MDFEDTLSVSDVPGFISQMSDRKWKAVHRKTALCVGLLGGIEDMGGTEFKVG